jgi:hypothetical protein
VTCVASLMEASIQVGQGSEEHIAEAADKQCCVGCSSAV